MTFREYSSQLLSELKYLGAPWDEYSRAAQSLSLAVIRIPMVEGFAPASPAELDAHLARIIRCHTLRGDAVLAHCRGGIGRAGLVSCCWMIKCGLLGLNLTLEGEAAKIEAMRVVERVIDVVRRRRRCVSLRPTIERGPWLTSLPIASRRSRRLSKSTFSWTSSPTFNRRPRWSLPAT